MTEKAKSRFTSLDVGAIINETSARVEGTHLQNIYDLTPKAYLLKFAKKDTKIQLIVEAGVRVHETVYGRENPNVPPSSFAAKLRKHLRDRRLTKFEQLGFDRIIHLEFGHDSRPEQCMHLFIELYSMGNIILTDYEYKILSLIREVKVLNKETGVETRLHAVGLKYEFSTAQEIELKEDVFHEIAALKGKETIRNACKSRLSFMSPSMIDHCLCIVSVDPKTPVDGCQENLSLIVEQLQKFTSELKGGRIKFCGILKEAAMDTRKAGILPASDANVRTYCDFEPIKFNQFLEPGASELAPKYREFTTFNVAVDEYFYALEETRNMAKAASHEAAIENKFAAIKREQEGRIAVLERVIDECLYKAHIVEANIKNVEDVIAVINMGLQNDLSWDNLDALIREERSRGRKTALLINQLKLHDNLVGVILDDGLGSAITLDVDIRLSGHANANRYYDLRKTAMDKLERTKASFVQAMKSAETKVRASNRLQKRKQQCLVAKRKPFWFEKFNWFISSDSYLVLSGKDGQQNEYLVKRYLRPGDAYVHADIHGASSVIIKNHRRPAIGEHPDDQKLNDPNVPIPYRTLIEAGAYSLCSSRAWDAKIVTSAWWVSAEQVSKTAPSGEYLAAGSFMIRGKKNFLPPAQLILGFGFMFILDADSAKRRKEARLFRESQRDQGVSEESHATNQVDPEKYLNLISVPISDPLSTQSEGGAGQVRETRNRKIDFPQNQSTPKGNGKHSPSGPDNKKGNAQVRGKSGQKKKIKGKYRDQDEEEREVRLALLGSRGQTKKELTSRALPQSGNIVTGKNPVLTSTPSIGVESQERKATIRKVITNFDELDISGEGEGEETEAEVAEKRGEDELAIIDSLTGSPSSSDVLINAIAVSAPFLVMQHYKYRVKLLPGALKRGTAAKLSLSIMFSEAKSSITPIERDLIRGVSEAELNSTIPGKVRLAASGVELGRAKKKVAKDKKKSAK